MNKHTQNIVAHLWFEVMWTKPDLDLADELIDPAYAPAFVQIPKKGPEQIKHEIRYFRTMFPDLKYTVVDSTQVEDRVWVRYRGTGTHLGKAWGFDPTGKIATFEGATILYLGPNGKVIDRWAAYSFLDIFNQLDLVPPFWELSQYFPQVKAD